MKNKQITKQEILDLYFTSSTCGILKFKFWYTNGQLEILNSVQGNTLQEKIYCLLFPEKSNKCEICNTATKLISIKKGFFTTCSKACASKKMWNERAPEKEVERQKKRQETNIKKYGVKDPMQLKEVAYKITKKSKLRTEEDRKIIVEKRKKTNLKKYGVEFCQSLEETKIKSKNTNLKKYGVENPSQVEEFKEKRKQTHLDKFGCENAFQAEELKEKAKKTILEKYGVENPSQYAKFAEKKIDTHNKNYGCDYPAQCLETFKAQQKGGFKRREFIFPSGKIVKLQGYEPFTLKELLETFDEEKIITNIKLMPEIWYTDNNNKKRRYFPDFFIPSVNKIIEVKSVWTMNLHLEINILKRQRCLEMGFDFEFRIYDGKMNLVDEKEFLN